MSSRRSKRKKGNSRDNRRSKQPKLGDSSLWSLPLLPPISEFTITDNLDPADFDLKCKVRWNQHNNTKVPHWEIDEKHGTPIDFSKYVEVHYVNRDLSEFVNSQQIKPNEEGGLRTMHPALENGREFIYILAFEMGYVYPNKDGSFVKVEHARSKQFALKIGYASSPKRLKNYLSSGGGFHRSSEYNEENPCAGIRILYLIPWKKRQQILVDPDNGKFLEPGFVFLDGKEEEQLVKKKVAKWYRNNTQTIEDDSDDEEEAEEHDGRAPVKYTFMQRIIETCFHNALKNTQKGEVKQFSYSRGLLTEKFGKSEFFLATRTAISDGFPFFFKVLPEGSGRLIEKANKRSNVYTLYINKNE